MTLCPWLPDAEWKRRYEQAEDEEAHTLFLGTPAMGLIEPVQGAQERLGPGRVQQGIRTAGISLLLMP